MLNGVNQMQQRAVAAAFAICRDRGPEGVSMRKLGRALNISGPALYHHFGNRQDLLNAVADHGFVLFEQRLRAIPAKRAQARIRALLEEYAAFARDYHRLFNLMFVEPRAGARRFPDDFAAGHSSVFNMLRAAVEQYGEKKGHHARGWSLETAQHLWALTHGQIMLGLAQRFRDDATFHRVLRRSIRKGISAI